MYVELLLKVSMYCMFYSETNLALICPSPKSFICNLPDPGRHMTRPNQGLALSFRGDG